MANGSHLVKGHVDNIGWSVLSAVGLTLSWIVVAQRFPARIQLDTPPDAVMPIGTMVSVQVRHE
jgi:membrane fusion protein, multidrug efflux system